MTSQHPAGIGTAFFPDPDVPANGSAGPAAKPDATRLRRLPRRRRPAMVALAIALAGAGVIVSAAVYRQADHQLAVVMVTQPVAAGGIITAADLASTNVTVGAAIQVIPAAQIGQVSGEIAAVTLRPATLLAPSELTVSQPPGPGQALVPAPVRPYVLPASGLFPGDHVLVIATPGDQGQPGASSAAPVLSVPVPAVVGAVDNIPDQDGLDVVDLLVSTATATAVAEQVSTGQFALVVAKRGD